MDFLPSYYLRYTFEYKLVVTIEGEFGYSKTFALTFDFINVFFDFDKIAVLNDLWHKALKRFICGLLFPISCCFVIDEIVELIYFILETFLFFWGDGSGTWWQQSYSCLIFLCELLL